MAHVAAWATHSVRLDREDVTVLVNQKITGDVLVSLTEANLTEMGMKVGPKKKLLSAIRDLQEVN